MRFFNIASIFSILVGVVLASAPRVNYTALCESSRFLHKRRLFVLTDVSNEPDDQMSLVRLLTYSNEIDIQGIAAVTSTWLNNTVDPETIRTVIKAYGDVVDNLNANVPDYAHYPSSETLLSKVTAGHAVYGLAALSLELSDAATKLIAAADSASVEDPLWVTTWGGANVLAEALNHVSKTRNNRTLVEFVSKLRFHSISDQDDAGPWIRQYYPQLFFVVSLHGFNEYYAATWTGISGEKWYHFDNGGPNTSLVTNEWLQEHIRIGPLGQNYPNFTVIMEGDTPSFFPLIPNGLGDAEHPEWGSWGGRYTLMDRSGAYQVYTNAADLALGVNGEYFVSQFASVWRWRLAYQSDFATRMQWTLNGNYAENNHQPVVVINKTCGPDALIVPFAFGESVVLDASNSWDPDDDKLSFEWVLYGEVSTYSISVFPRAIQFVSIETLDSSGAVVNVTPKLDMELHLILSVTDGRELGLTTYRRVILQPK